MILLARYSFLNLYLHESSTIRAMEAEWRGFVSSSFLRQAVTDAIGLARQHRITGWIADDRLLGPVRPADLDWISEHALPELVRIGLKRFARIEAEDPLNKLLISQLQHEVEETLPFQVRTFTDVQQARLWASGAV
ncbi:hypothetical protein [Solirubrum puertoriconensis]|uniref:STAS/SEC14 domain-containing protein n=1 Tax=Solirubrum puertoriconensis TaxID=1751427 RepID=A0A9X0HLB6_SOLP1|nr:hypothetical protein [Solirubrum puertoriconensis]KUG08068.1 hypothetical protein ASU33_07655 [Solirubrum puertoriconensis]